MRRLIGIALLCLAHHPAESATIHHSIIYDGPNTGCETCGEENYVCSSGTHSDLWNDGVRTFIDPTPVGALVTQVDAEIFGCTGSNYTIRIDGTVVGTRTANFSCLCGACDSHAVASSVFAEGWPGWVYGGLNSLQVDVTSGVVCVQRVELEIVYLEPSPTQVPISPLVTPLTAGAILVLGAWGFCRRATAKNS